MPRVISALILAAGASKRMPNHIKQLLPWGDTTLLNNAISQARPLVDSIHVVLGANSNIILPTLPFDISVSTNPNWEKGMGTSIAYGTRQIQQNEKTPDAILVMVCDQPLMDTEHLSTLLKKFNSNDSTKIVATAYKNGKNGVPAIFANSLFSELTKLDLDYGAKKLITENIAFTAVVSTDGKEVDVDTYDSYNQIYTDKHR